MSDDLIKRKSVITTIEAMFERCTTYDIIDYKELMLEAVKVLPSADRPQGYWTKTDIATYRCSECGKIQIADDVNELNFCCCCGSRNKIRRMKGADDEYDR